MVIALRELFAKSKTPSHDDKESAAHVLASIIEQAQAIGRAHASEEAHERGMSWGGSFVNALSSAWDIVSNFVQRIGDWISGQEADGVDVSEDDIIAEVDSLAETAASVEVASAIEQEVMDTLQSQGILAIRWIAQPGACEFCQSQAAMGSVPIGTDFGGYPYPPAHPWCRCSLAMGEEAE